jgi:glycosyltransferase involved in cell wall biosynthesis
MVTPDGMGIAGRGSRMPRGLDRIEDGLGGPSAPPASADQGPMVARRLKVCLASMAPFVGGAEVAAERLGLGLQEAGHSVAMLLGTRNAVMERMERAGLRCVQRPMCFTDKRHFLRYHRARSALRRFLERERPDVIHSNDLPTHQIVSDAAKGLEIPRVCHHRFPFGGEAIDWFLKFGAERHLFVSRALMEMMCGASARLRAGRLAVVHDGLPLPERPTGDDRRAARLRLGLDPGRVLVAFAGQIIERKGVADLIRAWMRLEAGLRDRAELLIIGDDIQNDGAYRALMQSLARELQCPARFLGFRSDVGDWLMASDIAAVPSHVEPLGNATLEAMSYGLPVVGAAVGGIPEMVVHERTGLLVPPGSPGPLSAALADLIGDGGRRARYGEQGRRRCEERFSLRAHVRGVLGEYLRGLPQLEVAALP